MKKNLTKVMAMGMVMTILAGTTAFAREEAAPVKEDAKVEATEQEKEEAAAFLGQSGKVVSVEDSETDGVKIVTIENEQGGLRFAVASNTMIVNRKDGAPMTAADLTEGMEICVVYAANSPMGMSLPPYLGKVSAVVANADAGLMTVGHFDADLTDMKNKLQLNISDDTTILNLQGTKIRLSAEDVKNQDALVFYGATTKSIPAQTNPSFVLLLEEAVTEVAVEETEAETKTREAEAVAETEEATLVPLRETAEELGFTVTWQGKTKPVLLEKEGVSIEVQLGSDSFVEDGDMVSKTAMKAELKDGVMYASSEIFA